jgi:16S rRNA (uracil1498-N3)-methyltransferase
LSESETGHARARRLSAGDAVLLVDGSGREAEGEILGLAGGTAEILVKEVRPALPSGPAVWLGVAAVRPERIAWIAEKAGELAVETLALVRSERAQAFRAGPAVLARLERLVREAAKQSGSARWPSCEGPIDLDAALVSAPGDARIFLDFEGDPFPAALSASSAAILVGPEGGWTDSERDAAARAGWRSLSLPAGKLRTETAAVAAVVLALAAIKR